MRHVLDERFILTEADDTPKDLDWEAMYKSCKEETDYKQFWYGTEGTDEPKHNGYFKEVWGDKLAEIQRFDDVFKRIVIKYGFDLEENGLLKFLRLFYEHGQINRTGLKTITKDDLLVLLKAYERSVLTKEDLTPSTSPLKNHAVVFNPYFYIDLVEADQNTLLQLQHDYQTKTTPTDWSMACTGSERPGGKFLPLIQIKDNLGIEKNHTARIEDYSSDFSDLNPDLAKSILAGAYIVFSCQFTKIANNKALTAGLIDRAKKIPVETSSIVTTLQKYLKLKDARTFDEKTAVAILNALDKQGFGETTT